MNKIFLEFENVGVDSGYIFVGDYSFAIKKNISRVKKLVGIANIENGRYNAKLTIFDTWVGDIVVKGVVEITSGKLIIGDPGYFIKSGLDDIENGIYSKDDKWLKTNGVILTNDMEGDGVYRCILELTPI